MAKAYPRILRARRLLLRLRLRRGLFLRARRLLLRLRLRRGLFLARRRRMRCIFNLPRLQEIYRIHAIIRRHRILRLLRLRSFLRSPASTTSSSSAAAAAAKSSASSASTSSASAVNAALTDKDIKALFCHRTRKAPCLECVKRGHVPIKAMTHYNLKKHMSTTHSYLRFPCPTCANKFKFAQEISEHREKHHGRGR